MSGVEEELHLLGTEAPVARSETTVSTNDNAVTKVLGALGAIVVVAVLWSLLSSGSSDDQANGVVDDTTETTQPEPAPTFEADRDDGMMEEALTGERIDPAIPGFEDAGGQPVLSESGELVGSDLVQPGPGPLDPDSNLSIVVNNFSGDIEVVNLATGQISEHRIAAGQFITQIGDQLLFQEQPTGGFVVIADVGDLDGDVIRVAPPGSFAVAVAAWPDEEGPGEAETATVLWSSFDEEVAKFFETTIELETGRILATNPTDPRRGPIVFSSGYAANPDVFTPPTGGVYARDGDDYLKVLDGRLLAVDDRFALVQNCDEALQCVRQWHEVGTWDAVVRPLPEVAFELGLLLGDSRLIAYLDPGNRSIVLFDVELDREVPFDWPANRFGPSVSPDGSYLSYFVDNGQLALVDLATLEQRTVSLESRSGNVAFVENAPAENTAG